MLLGYSPLTAEVQGRSACSPLIESVRQGGCQQEPNSTDQPSVEFNQRLQRYLDVSTQEIVDFRYRPYLTTIQEILPCGLQGFDALYLINLARRPEKLALSRAQLTPWGLTPSRVEAIDGRELTCAQLSQLGLLFQPWMEENIAYQWHPTRGKQIGWTQPSSLTWFTRGSNKAAVAIVLSHLSAIYDAYARGFQRIWIVEDDISILENPHLLPAYIQELETVVGPDGWDILYTDPDTRTGDARNERLTRDQNGERPDLPRLDKHSPRNTISTHWFQYGTRYGTYSQCVSRAGMQKLLSFYHIFGIFSALDSDTHLIPGLRRYGLYQDLATHLFSVSDNLDCDRPQRPSWSASVQ